MEERGMRTVRTGKLAAEARRAEREFHIMLSEMVRRALGRGVPPQQIRHGLVRHFLTEPTLRAADPYEQERVVCRMQQVIDAVLASA